MSVNGDETLSKLNLSSFEITRNTFFLDITYLFTYTRKSISNAHLQWKWTQNLQIFLYDMFDTWNIHESYVYFH